MAWYAELKRRKWYCINGMDAVATYKKQRYDEWYASLTDEEKELLARREQEERERSLKSLQNFIMGTAMIFSQLSRHAHPNYMGPFGKPMYDDNGFVNPDAFKED